MDGDTMAVMTASYWLPVAIFIGLLTLDLARRERIPLASAAWERIARAPLRVHGAAVTLLATSRSISL
jgi:hypothetical protein